MTNPHPTLPATPATATAAEPTLRTIAFAAAGCRFALPIAAVLQVSACPPRLERHDEAIGLTIYEDRTILLLNLQVKLARRQLPTVEGTAAEPASLASPAARTDMPQPHLVLTQTQRGELCGVLVDELPAMLELPRREIQPIPRSYRESQLFGLARFVALWRPSPQADRVAIYLLDIERAIRHLS